MDCPKALISQKSLAPNVTPTNAIVGEPPKNTRNNADSVANNVNEREGTQYISDIPPKNTGAIPMIPNELQHCGLCLKNNHLKNNNYARMVAKPASPVGENKHKGEKDKPNDPLKKVKRTNTSTVNMRKKSSWLKAAKS